MRIKLSTNVEGVREDINEEKKEIEISSLIALSEVGEDMKLCLQEHIHNDWYEKWGEPREYQRRTDDPSLGTPIGDISNMESYVLKSGLRFRYNPKGNHKNEKWSIQNGDDLIRIIQDNLGWKWKPTEDTEGRMIMPRPFWDNFVEEEETRALSSFINALRKVNGEIDIVEEPNERIDLSEYKLS